MFVCHSLGGLLVRQWLLSPENQQCAGGVISLGTPHKGSKVAALAPGSLAKNLIPGAEFINKLQSASSYPNMPHIALVSPMDEVVLPAANLVPPEGWRMRVTNAAGHFSMLFCPKVAGIVMRELEEIAAAK